MSRVVFAFALHLFATPLFAAAVAEMPQLQIFVLLGQSNMAGRGALVADSAVAVHPRVFKFTRDQMWVPATEPLHFDSSRAGAGLAASFAATLADADPHIAIGLVPCAVGNTPLSRWEPGGDLLASAIARTKAALRAGKLRGFLWHQGESDAKELALAATYACRLAATIRHLRVELNAAETPFLVGRLGEWLRVTTHPHAHVLNEQLTALPLLVPWVTIVDSTGLMHRGDFAHFDTPSLRGFGVRFAESLISTRQ